MRDRPEYLCDRTQSMAFDVLSDALSAFSPVARVVGALDLGGEWAVDFPAHEGMKVFAVASGQAWLHVEGEAEAVHLVEGECVILPNGRPFSIARDLSYVATPIQSLIGKVWTDGVAQLEGGGDTILLAGHFSFSSSATRFLIGEVPPILKLQEGSNQGHLRWILQNIGDELFSMEAGSEVAVHHLTHLLLLQALRLYLEKAAGHTRGWLFALYDPRLGRAIQAIHAAPSEAWTLSRLAAAAGMSRSKFAERFHAITGTSPIEYVIRWRMMLACRHLVTTKDAISRVALSLGYQSEAAFSTAFKRVIGRSPSSYRKEGA